MSDAARTSPARNRRHRRPVEVQIRRYGQRLVVEPHVPELDLLRTQAIHYDGRAVQRVAEPLGEWLLSNAVSYPAGYLEPLRILLSEAGYSVDYCHVEFGPRQLAPPELSQVAFVTAADRGLVQWMQANERGLIPLSDDQDVLWLIIKTALAFPEARIAIIAGNIETVRRLASQLRRVFPDVRSYTSRSPIDGGNERIVVSTLHGLCAARVDWRDIIIFLDGLTAITQHAVLALDAALRARLFGFLGPRQHPSPRERALLAGRFGFHEHRLPPLGQRIVPIAVRRLRIAGGPRISAGRDLVALKRDGIWAHAVRNRQIIRLARDLESRDVYQQLKVAVLVENLEQALHLARRLPGWAVVTVTSPYSAGLRAWQRDLLAERRIDDASQKIIVTFAGLQQLDICRANIIIRADLERRRRRQIVPERSWFERCADHEQLLPVFHRLKREAGQAPGDDDLTYADVGRSEAAALMRDLARSIRDDDYRPLPAREVPIPRHGRPNDPRILRLRGILDRVVATAVNDYVAPLLDRHFLGCSYGFRAGRNVQMMLADMDVTVVTQDRAVLAVDDVYKAFDHVIISQAMADLRRNIDCPRLLSLIQVILQGDDEQKTIGIDQGSALSPVVMNLVLHHALDLPVNADAAHPPLHRYADNLVYLCRDVAEAGRALTRATELLAPAAVTPSGLWRTGWASRFGGTAHDTGQLNPGKTSETGTAKPRPNERCAGSSVGHLWTSSRHILSLIRGEWTFGR